METKHTQIKEAVFMIGSPASGKSTIAQKKFSNFIILDCDKIKETHPDYNPKNPSILHDWSNIELEKQFQNQCFKHLSFVVDGTGANSDKLVRRITEAKNRGFKTRLVYVTCSLKECLKRNSLRDRVVSEAIIKEKYKDIDYSFKLVSPHADKIEVINSQ